MCYSSPSINMSPFPRRKASDEEENRAGGGAFEGYPTTLGGAVLYARVDGRSEEPWRQSDFGETDAPCLQLQIHVGDRDEEGTPTRLGIWTSEEADCETG